MTKSLFVSGTDTNVGKTYYSIAILKQLTKHFALDQLAYYKPVQSGDEKDYDVIRQGLPGIATYTSYDLTCAASPDYAASIEGVKISLAKIANDFKEIQAKHKFVIVEGAGGLAVPLNDRDLVSDIAKSLNVPMILVIGRQLGTINHSLLAIEHARSRGIEIAGIIVSDLGDDDERTRASIESIKKLGKVKEFDLASCLNKN
ncbi:MAG: dethiobiotin synthase [Candidatus Melainabacteria bacterium]|jgi:dethiobiotin synthetase|nr:dethiobiotin synthase [Candidatus Melainabacteria bacterium]